MSQTAPAELGDGPVTPPQPGPKPATKRGPRAGLVGPLFGWELVRLARRGQDMRARFILAVTLLFVLTIFTLVWFRNVDPADVFFGTSQSLSIEDSARFGESFAFTFVLAQLGVMILLTPAYAAGGISEEKEKKTFPYLLVSDLTSREILLGKFLGRVVFLLGVMFAGLPILALTTLYGGVSINFLLMSYLVTATTVVMQAAVSASCAMATDTYRGALFRGYGLAALHTFVGCGFHPVLSPFGIVALLRSSEGSGGWFAGIGFAYAAGESLVAAGAVALGVRWTRQMRSRPRDRAPRAPVEERRRSARPAPVAAPAAEADDYELLTGDAELLIVETGERPLATARLLDAPPVAPRPAARDTEEPRFRRRRRPPPVRTPVPLQVRERPRIGDHDPFEWKERYTTGHKRTADDESMRGVLVAVGIAVGVTVAFFGMILVFALVVSEFSDTARSFATSFFLVTGVGATFVYLLTIGSAASGAVVGERQRNTLESLLMIPVERRQILRPKYRFAASRALAWGAPASLMIPAGFLFSRVPTVALPMGLFVVLSGLMVVGYGLLLSVRCQTATKAAMWLLPAIAAVTLVPLAFWVLVDDFAPAFWTAAACLPVPVVGLLAWYFWRRAVQEFERTGRN